MNPLIEKAVLIVMIAVLLSAGCISQDPGSQNPVQTPAGQLPIITTPAPATQSSQNLFLSDLAISRTDLPFTSVREYGTCQYASLSQPPTGYKMHFLDNPEESKATIILTQGILGFPAGEAAPTFANVTTFYLSMNKPPVSITRLPDPGIGDESVALSGENSGQNPSKGFMIMFRKNDIIETIEYSAPAPDYARLKATAAAAAARIQPGRYTMPAECPTGPAPAIATSAVPSTPDAAAGTVHSAVQPAASGISLARPVQIAISPSGSVGTISLGLVVTPGNQPVDMTRMSYIVSTPATMKSISGTDPSVRLTWSTASAGSDNQLGTGETVTVDLDVSSMGISPKVSGAQITIEARPVVGASLPKRCTLPATVPAGSTFQCT
jgi:archaellin